MILRSGVARGYPYSHHSEYLAHQWLISKAPRNVIVKRSRTTCVNRAGKSVIKTQIKKVHAVTAAGDKAASQTEFRVAVKKIDQMAAKGIIHKNKASRLKSRLVKNVKKLAAPAK